MPRHPRSTVHPEPVPQVTVTIAAGLVVIEPPGELDHDATDALVQMVAAALTTGESVMLRLDRKPALDADLWPHAGPGHAELAATPQRGATAIAAGYVRIDTGSDTWTLDLVRHRFCRSESPVDPRFVESPSWTAIRAAWITPERTTVMTAAGTYVSAPSRWAGVEAVVAA